MNNEISLEDKHEFVKWILECVKLKRKECEYLFRKLSYNKELLEKVCFVDRNANHAPFGAIVSAREVVAGIPFRYFKNKLMTAEVHNLIYDISNVDAIFYIQVNVSREYRGDAYYRVIEEYSHNEKEEEETCHEEIEGFIDSLENLGARRVILSEIDMALDTRDKKRFNELTKKLMELHKPLDNKK